MNKRDRALIALQERKKLSNTQLAKVCGYRYGAIIHVLRDAGHDIGTIETDDPAKFFYVHQGFSQALADERAMARANRCKHCGQRLTAPHRSKRR